MQPTLAVISGRGRKGLGMRRDGKGRLWKDWRKVIA